MSGYDYSDILDDDGRQEASPGGALRRQLEETLAANKKLTERLDALERKANLEPMLKEKGIDPAVAQIMPKDANPDEWLTQFGHLFRSAKGETLDAPSAAQQPNQNPTPEELAEQQALQQMQGVVPTGDSVLATQDPIEKLKGFTNEADLIAFLQQGGMDAGGGGGVFR